MRNQHSLDHIVQRQIFDRLVQRSSASFSELKPNDVDSNLFTYHLKKLVEKGFVEKVSPGTYALSDDGRFFAGNYSTNKKDFVFGPTTFSIIAVYNKSGHGPLAFRRKREPYFNKLSLISGKVHLGESLLQAAKRELQEKAEITGQTSMDYAGTAAIYGEDGNHITGIVWRVEVKTFAAATTKNGKTETVDWNTIDANQTIFGTKEIIELLSSKQPFFTELRQQP